MPKYLVGKVFCTHDEELHVIILFKILKNSFSFQTGGVFHADRNKLKIIKSHPLQIGFKGFFLIELKSTIKIFVTSNVTPSRNYFIFLIFTYTYYIFLSPYLCVSVCVYVCCVNACESWSLIPVCQTCSQVCIFTLRVVLLTLFWSTYGQTGYFNIVLNTYIKKEKE